MGTPENMCRDGLVGYDAALTRLRSGVRFPLLVLRIIFYTSLHSFCHQIITLHSIYLFQAFDVKSYLYIIPYSFSFTLLFHFMLCYSSLLYTQCHTLFQLTYCHYFKSFKACAQWKI